MVIDEETGLVLSFSLNRRLVQFYDFLPLNAETAEVFVLMYLGYLGLEGELTAGEPDVYGYDNGDLIRFTVSGRGVQYRLFFSRNTANLLAFIGPDETQGLPG